ncbi:hypothetical protein CR513_49401, partial [Mucuna pruriens]
MELATLLESAKPSTVVEFSESGFPENPYCTFSDWNKPISDYNVDYTGEKIEKKSTNGRCHFIEYLLAFKQSSFRRNNVKQIYLTLIEQQVKKNKIEEVENEAEDVKPLVVEKVVAATKQASNRSASNVFTTRAAIIKKRKLVMMPKSEEDEDDQPLIRRYKKTIPSEPALNKVLMKRFTKRYPYSIS